MNLNYPTLMSLLLATLAQSALLASDGTTLQSRYAQIRIDEKGFITSLVSRQSGKKYTSANHPSPLMSLHESGSPNDKLLSPVSAAFHDGQCDVKYPNGSIAVIRVSAKDCYFRFQLVSLSTRDNIDNIVWGPLNTTISARIGDLLGVVRSDDWAIGMLGLDDNTISGPVVDSDCYQMGYVVHSPNPARYPLPPQYKEGQWFSVGGNGVSDTAFFSHPQEYFQFVCGTGAKLEPDFGSSVTCHARDRRKPYVCCWSLIPGFPLSRPRHMVSDPIPGVDFIGSSVALYACPDDSGLPTLEKIVLQESLPYITDRDGKWIRDPAAWRPTVYWNGPMEKAIEYTKALGLKDISRDTGEWYPSLDKKWVGRVGFTGGKTLTYKEYADLAHKEGLTHGGLHTLCTFLQGGISHDVTPAPSEHLQTVCRTILAQDISATDTAIVVTDPSFLAEKGVWTRGDTSNYLRIGSEMLRYDGISAAAPWTLLGVKRAHASKPAAHKAGDEVAKLMQNCYNGFVPDMTLSLEYADYYADLMARNGMDTINFDGFESNIYQNHGYYGVATFCRRLFETYHKLTGNWPRVTGSNVFPGAWLYFNVCDIGGGDHMFNAVNGRRNIEGKDIGNGWANSYYPGTFGIQGWCSDWSLYDAENLQSKAVGWDATYALSISQQVIDCTGERDDIFKAFRAWQTARAQSAFTRSLKEKLRDPDRKFHLEQTGPRTFQLYSIQELHFTADAVIANSQAPQPLQFAMRLAGPAAGVAIDLPDGTQIKCDRKIEPAQFIICKAGTLYLADKYRKKLTDLTLPRPATLPQGASKLTVHFTGKPSPFRITTWIVTPPESLPQ